MFEPKRISKREPMLLTFSSHGPHAKIIRYVGKNKRVLDVGCATGYLDKQLKRDGCYVVGIEVDREAANLANRYCDKVLVRDVEKLEELPYSAGFFDVIVMSEVLEHLKRPDLVLLKLKKYLATDGYVVASVPNVARFEIRLALLFGKFEYGSHGALSPTHLRFFTLKTAKRLFEENGYEVIKVDYTGLPSKIKMLRALPTLFAYNFIIIAKPRQDSQ